MLLVPTVEGVSAGAAWEGVVLDAASEQPIAGALVKGHESGVWSVTDHEGRFSLPHPRQDDVLLIGARGYTSAAWFAAATGPADLVVRLSPIHDIEPRVETFRAARVLDPAIGIAGWIPRSMTSDPVRVPFTVGPGASEVAILVEWSPSSTEVAGEVLLMAEVVHKSGKVSAGRYDGGTPLQFELPEQMIQMHSGEWELILRPLDSFELRVEVDIEIEVSYGSVMMRNVHGMPPEVQSPPGARVANAPPTMDILEVSLQNETFEGLEVRLGLAQVGTMKSKWLPYAHWIVAWEQEGQTWFVAFSTIPPQTAPPSGEPYDLSIGVCQDICRKWYPVVASFEWGTPGAIRFVVPKHLVGAPSNGTILTNIRAIVYESNDDLVTLLDDRYPNVNIVDATLPGRDYVIGASRYVLDPSELHERLSGPATAIVPAHDRADRFGGASIAGHFLISVSEAPGAWLAGSFVASTILLATLRMRAKTPPAPSRLIGGRYRLIREVGRGTNGVVWLGEDRRLGRKVAVKIHPAGSLIEKGRCEAQLLAQVNHPHIVQVLDVIETFGRTAIVMEFLPGGTLADRLVSGGRVPRPESIRIWRSIASALAAAHRRGIVHHDVKPANVLLSDDNTVKLADFGVAKSMRPNQGHSQVPGALSGTPMYMAPEQLECSTPTARSDIYSAAALVYHLLAGHPAVEVKGCRSIEDVFRARRLAGPPTPIPGEPEWINDLLRDCMHPLPDARPSAEDVLRRLDHLCVSEFKGDSHPGDGWENTIDLRPQASCR